MKRCKHCREEIVEGWEKSGGELIAPWMHKSGTYTCRYRPENLAEPADERWEKVWARIGKPECPPFGDPEGTLKEEDYLQLYIRVEYQGRLYYSNHLMLAEDHFEFGEDVLRWMLNEMCKHVDQFMEKEGK
jgi:hypothetical protein